MVPIDFVVVAFIIVVTAGVAAGGGPAPVNKGGEGGGNGGAEEETVIEVTVFENGTARWSVKYLTPLQEEGDPEDFEAFADRFNANRSNHVEPFRERMQSVVSQAENDTNREMQATDFTAEAYVAEPPGVPVGIVEFSFYWAGFAQSTDYGVVVGDAFSGNFSIDEGQKLVIVGPEDTHRGAVVPEPSNSVSSKAEWEGPQTFGDARPHVQFVFEGEVSDSEDDFSPGRRLAVLSGLIVAGILGVGVGSVAYLRRQFAPED